MMPYQYTRRVDKNIYKSINLIRAASFFVCEFKIPAVTACPQYIYFTILNSEIRSTNLRIRNSELWNSREMKSEPS